MLLVAHAILTKKFIKICWQLFYILQTDKHTKARNILILTYSHLYAKSWDSAIRELNFILLHTSVQVNDTAIDQFLLAMQNGYFL